MTEDLRTLLHEAAASPTGTTDYQALAARGRTWRRVTLTGAAFVLLVVASVAVVALQAPPALPVIGDEPTPTEPTATETAPTETTPTPAAHNADVLAVAEAFTGDAARAVITDQAELDAYFEEWRYLSPSRPPTLSPGKGALIVAIESSLCHNQQLAISEVTFTDVATVHFTATPDDSTVCLSEARLVYVIGVALADASRVSDVTAMLGLASIDAGWSRPAEWPARDWYGPDDPDAPTEDVFVFPGASHCDWQHLAFLVSPSRSDAQDRPIRYVRDPYGYLVEGHLEDAVLPDDAAPSGYWTVGWELWFADSDDAAYLVADDGHVERWPPYVGQCV